MSHLSSQMVKTLLKPGNVGEPFVERLFFNHRPVLMFLFLAATLFFGYQASQVRPDANFEKMIPTYHPYIANYLNHKDDLKGLGNVVRISVESTEGDIYTAEFQSLFKQIHDELFYIPGIDRAALKSIWSPSVRWTEVTEEGLAGGPVIAATYNGSDEELEKLRSSVRKSGQVGALVANNFRSALIYAPLLDINPETGEPIDYQVFSERLETLVRDKYQSESVKIHITGFVKVVGDLIDGAGKVVVFFAMALVITLILLYAYSRCVRSTLVPLFCSVIAVVWQLGLLKTLGYGLDPYSMLMPFLVFAIGVSHGVQIINAIAHESTTGAGKELAARRAFRALYIPGIIALVSDGAGFASLMVIEIAVIQDLAVAASLGVAVIILTNLILLPVLMSYVGVRQRSGNTEPQAGDEQSNARIWHLLSGCTQKPQALVLIVLALGLSVLGLYESKGLKIGDLDAGAPELRPDSRYNLDNAFISENYATSTDIFVVMVQTAKDKCSDYRTLDAIDQLQWRLQQIPGVQSARSLVDETKQIMAGYNEGNIKWYSLNRNQALLDQASVYASPSSFNADCSLTPVMIYLNDHKAVTLQSVVTEAESFINEFKDVEDITFKLAAGNAGITAATNIVIEKAQYQMLFWVYSVVGILCLLTFRSFRTVLCILLPLALTSLLCQALMARLGIGVKVATLPVIALGVGIGVDYGIYIYSKLQAYLNAGQDLREAYFNTLKTTGKAVAFTGLTLGIGVGTWVLSPIKFQADMGILLTFMFVWNMVGALVLLPALAAMLIKRTPMDRA
ncbi:efflux RND transporter permease subunit [Amphritea japonica]|uniref:RND family efflux transporter n=1 Tax=Amphritea japonica ATCC BAA-1530 TaxID=1278309 RepID=A0A7R6STA6_9GAMM|nr:MMPL family transporter [Amphritea japonica]BBB27106.1 RND family efflux transporter [Amphritea japonica ATCC BAA-1530]